MERYRQIPIGSQISEFSQPSDLAELFAPPKPLGNGKSGLQENLRPLVDQTKLFDKNLPRPF